MLRLCMPTLPPRRRHRPSSAALQRGSMHAEPQSQSACADIFLFDLNIPWTMLPRGRSSKQLPIPVSAKGWERSPPPLPCHVIAILFLGNSLCHAAPEAVLIYTRGQHQPLKQPGTSQGGKTPPLLPSPCQGGTAQNRDPLPCSRAVVFKLRVATQEWETLGCGGSGQHCQLGH
ncbi:unnamed protein product [Caretta caretta]